MATATKLHPTHKTADEWDGSFWAMSMDSVIGVAGRTGLRNLMQSPVDVAHRVERRRDGSILQNDRQAACGMVHAGSDVLHRLRHERSQMRGTVEAQRAHSESFFRELCGCIKFIIGNAPDDLVQAGKVVAHVAQHVLLHGFGQSHEFARVLGLGWTGKSDHQGCR